MDGIPRTAHGKVAYDELRPVADGDAADLGVLLDRLAGMTDEEAERLLADTQSGGQVGDGGGPV